MKLKFMRREGGIITILAEKNTGGRRLIATHTFTPSDDSLAAIQAEIREHMPGMARAMKEA